MVNCRLRLIGFCVLLIVAGFMLAPMPVAAYEVLTPPIKGKSLVNARRAESHLVIKATDKNEAAQLSVGRIVNREGDSISVEAIGSWQKMARSTPTIFLN